MEHCVIVYGNPTPDEKEFEAVAEVKLDCTSTPVEWRVLVGDKNVYSDFSWFVKDPNVREHKVMFVSLDPDTLRIPEGFVFDEEYKAPGSHDDPGFCVHDGEIFIHFFD